MSKNLIFTIKMLFTFTAMSLHNIKKYESHLYKNQFGKVLVITSLSLCDKFCGNLTSNVTNRSPLCSGFLGLGRPCPANFLTTFNRSITLLRSKLIFSLVRVGICITLPQRTCLMLILHVCLKLQPVPTRLKLGCTFRWITKITSAGMWPRIWSPSFSKVTVVPDL